MKKWMMPWFCLGTMLVCVPGWSAQGFEYFITRTGDKLYEGDRQYCFISFNVPCLHYVEDDLQFDNTMPFRFPDPYEIEDALQTIRQMGGRVARTYTLSVRRELDRDTRPVHVLAPGEFNEEAFVVLDHFLARGRGRGVLPDRALGISTRSLAVSGA